MSPLASRQAAHVGRAAFAAAIAAFGMLQLRFGGFVTRLFPAWPASVPHQPVWAAVIGVALIIVAVGLLTARGDAFALALAGAVFLSAVVLAVPPVFHDHIGLAWTNAGKALMLGGGALLIAGAGQRWPGASPFLVGLGRALLAAFFILCGVQHFLWAQFVVGLVPGWIPAPMFWTYAAGVFLIAGGVGMLWRPTRVLAAELSALMVFLWLILLHIPRTVADWRHSNETVAVFEALAVVSIALMVAAEAAEQRAGLKTPRQAPSPQSGGVTTKHTNDTKEPSLGAP